MSSTNTPAGPIHPDEFDGKIQKETEFCGSFSSLTKPKSLVATEVRFRVSVALRCDGARR